MDMIGRYELSNYIINETQKLTKSFKNGQNQTLITTYFLFQNQKNETFLLKKLSLFYLENSVLKRIFILLKHKFLYEICRKIGKMVFRIYR